MENDLHQRIVQAILEIDEEETLKLTRKSLEKLPPEKIISALSEGLRQMGDLFEKGQRYIPELVIAAEFVDKAFKILEPHLPQREEGKAGSWRGVKVVMATVEGDIHDLGKNLVSTMLSAAGFQVIDLGKDVSAETIVSKVEETEAQVVGLSALLTTTMAHQEEVIKLLTKRGMREKVKVIVGGAPASQSWAQQIGADAYAENAMEAVRKVKELLRGEP